MPALAVVICSTLAFGWFALKIAAYERLGFHALASALFFPNFVYWSEAGYFDSAAESKYLLHTWSLGVEEQFYLFWPLFLTVLKRQSLRPFPLICGLSAASLAYSSIAAFHDPVAAFYSPLSRFWELGTGAALASCPCAFRHSNAASGAGLVLIFGAAFLLTSNVPFPGLLAIIPVAGASLVVVSRSSLLGKAPFVAIGLISYPLYLWHWPLLTLARLIGLHTELAKAIVIALSFLLAAMTTRYIENPIRFGGLRIRGTGISLAGTACAVVLAAAVYLSGGAQFRAAAAIRSIVAYENYDDKGAARSHTCWLPIDAKFTDFSAQCTEGQILIWGDSQSALLSTGFPKPVAELARSTCPPLLASDGLPHSCAEGSAQIVDALKTIKPARLIMFARWSLKPSDWNNVADLDNTLREVRANVRDVILLGPAPAWQPSLPEAIMKYWGETRDIPDRLPSSVPEDNYRFVDQAMGAVAKNDGVRFISMFDTLCDASGCLTHTPRSRSDLLTWDYGHLTVDGASFVVQMLGLARLPK